MDAELLDYIRDVFERNGHVVQKMISILKAKGVTVTDISEGCIQVTFTCKSIDSLHNLQKLYTSGELENLLNEAFCPRFDDKGLDSMNLEITDEMFTQCAETFSRWTLMTPEHRLALESSADWLVDKITISDDLLDKLSLCERRRQAIERAATSEQQVKTLINIVSRRPDSAFTQLLNALNDTQQSEVASHIHRFLSADANSAGNCMNDTRDRSDNELSRKIGLHDYTWTRWESCELCY